MKRNQESMAGLIIEYKTEKNKYCFQKIMTQPERIFKQIYFDDDKKN